MQHAEEFLEGIQTQRYDVVFEAAKAGVPLILEWLQQQSRFGPDYSRLGWALEDVISGVVDDRLVVEWAYKRRRMQAVALGALIDKRAAGNHLSEQEERRLSERPIEATCAYLAAYRGHVGQVPPPHAGIRMFSLQRSARQANPGPASGRVDIVCYISTPRSFTAKRWLSPRQGRG